MPDNSVLLEEEIYSFRTGKPTIDDYGQHDYYKTVVLELKPYLRSMEDMTEEEKKELRLLKDSFEFNCYTAGNYSFQVNLAVADWLNKHHFDYRGLIPMGLAIEVTPENNPYNTK